MPLEWSCIRIQGEEQSVISTIKEKDFFIERNKLKILKINKNENK